ncbi:DUF2487 family protein [Pullulanibacillus sp. KACC 23026]|uniref:DUF2487 family protein n=1 Tax=Pullulanibacillus sp. KACC 23026 TaxID=3028315 RepID=UPI0023B1F615|nr:DUF2487 family protein [Pullulanibacillus sp. KACC 23026]WEG11359.1 DUF2487 family protein [Pullulanibacillus sp. KACC 23026]
MKWTVKDMDVSVKEKAYIDTVLIPFVPIEWGNEMGNAVVEGHYSLLLGEETERQLKGRVILSPPFTYLKKIDEAEKKDLFQPWIQEIKESDFKHIVCLVSDPDFSRTQTDELGEHVQVVWMPAIPIEHMDSTYKQDYLNEQVAQIMKKITQAWSLQK